MCKIPLQRLVQKQMVRVDAPLVDQGNERTFEMDLRPTEPQGASDR